MNSKELSNFLEKIRYGRKITQEDFVDGIVSLRQYQRYRRGECEIPYEKIDEFALKLGIPSKKLLIQFEEEKTRQNKLINNLYNAVVVRDLERVNELKALLKKEVFIDHEKLVYYEHALAYDDLYSQKINKLTFIERTSPLVGYPEILKRAYFTDVEVLILSSLLDYVDLPKKELLVQRLADLFENSNYIIGNGSDMIETLILMRIAKTYGLQHDYASVIHFADMGIQRGLTYKQFYLLDHLYYYKAIACFRLEDFTMFEEALFRCYNVLHVANSPQKIQHYQKLIEKDFEIDYDVFILKYLKKKLK